MRIEGNGALYQYFSSLIGTTIRNRVLGQVWEPGTNLADLYSMKTHIKQGVLAQDKFSIFRSLTNIAKESPNKITFTDKYNTYTATEILSNIKKVCAGLKSLGIKAGDRVALMALPHERELFESFCAIQAIGAVPVLINFLNPPETIAYMFSRSGAKTLIVGRDSRLRTGANKLALGGLLENVITIGRTEYPARGAVKTYSPILKKLSNNALAAYNPTFFTYNALLNKPELSDEELVLNPDKNAPALELYTSGTEKKPKKMTYTYENVANQAERTSSRFPTTSKDVIFFPVPFYHLAGLIVLMEALYLKLPISLAEVPRASEPRTVNNAISTIIKDKTSVFPGVPRIIEPVLEEAIKRGLILENLRLIISGAAPLTPKLVQLVESLNEKRALTNIAPIELVNFYASTECGPISATATQPTLETLDTLGIPFNGVEVKISNDDSNELLVRPPHFPPELASDTLTFDGFFKTGDQVVIDNNSNLIYQDRLSDRLNVNGEKISPLIIQREVEEVPGIKETHVFGVPKPETGTDIVAAIVIPKDNISIEPSVVRKHLEKRLPPELKAFIPSVIFVKPEGIPLELIKGPGKVPRRLLRKFYGDEVIQEYNKIKSARLQSR